MGGRSFTCWYFRHSKEQLAGEPSVVCRRQLKPGLTCTYSSIHLGLGRLPWTSIHGVPTPCSVIRPRSGKPELQLLVERRLNGLQLRVSRPLPISINLEPFFAVANPICRKLKQQLIMARCIEENAMAAIKKNGPILQPISTLNVRDVERFVVRDKFCESSVVDRVKLASFGENFRRHFLGVVETTVPPTELKVRKLLSAASDESIFRTLGDNCVMRLAHLWEILGMQPDGETGVLNTSGRANIAYIREADGSLFTVGIYWRNGWSLQADPVEGQELAVWRKGCRTISSS